MIKEIPFKEEYKKLNLLLSQGQFELILPKVQPGDIRLVYLMNDAVESFLVFRKARFTGVYQEDFQGELWADLDRDGGQYVLIVHQDDTVCTLFFERLELETSLFNYGKTGHFWVKGYEYLRQLEYRLAILRDKKVYLGDRFCTEEERKLACLAEFPPLNFCCYPAVSHEHLVPFYPWWQVSEEALQVMTELCDEAGDRILKRWIALYGRFPRRIIAKKIAGLLHTVRHAGTVDLLTEKLTQAAAVYKDRDFENIASAEAGFGAAPDENEIRRIREIMRIAEKRKKELEFAGKSVEMLREEPFLYVRDSVEYKIHLMIWRKEGRNRKVDIETIE